MIEFVLGAGFACLMIVVSKLKDIENFVYTGSLFILPLIYCGFALLADESGLVLKELAWGSPYIIASAVLLVFAFRGSHFVVAFLWLSHGVYDVYHDYLFINSGVFSWYPLLCLGTDVTIALYLLRMGRK